VYPVHTVYVINGKAVGHVGHVCLLSERCFLHLLWSPII